MDVNSRLALLIAVSLWASPGCFGIFVLEKFMNARLKSFCSSSLCRFPLAGLPLFGLVALGTPSAFAEPITIQPTAPATTAIMAAPAGSPDADLLVDPKDYPQGILFPYSLIDRALYNNVDLEGKVLYPNLKGNKHLDMYIKAVAVADLTQFPVFDVYKTDPKTGRESKVTKNRAPELVFWINTYNAMVLSTIANAYPIKAITEIKDFDTAQTHLVAGKNYSFKDMRDKILSFGDPRAVFALVSGTAGGFLPSPTAIRYIELDRRLDAAISIFVNDPRNVTLNRIQNLVTVSPIFKEVDAHFKIIGGRKKWDGIRAVLSGYTEQRGPRAYFTTNDYRIEFGQYDRSINDRSGGQVKTAS